MPGIKKTMEEFKSGKLHSGSKKGPVVINPKQAIAIGINSKRKAKRKPDIFSQQSAEQADSKTIEQRIKKRMGNVKSSFK